MGSLFSNLVFLHPWLLAGLAALPALWFLLRIMPPSPQRIILPSLRFLDGLVPEEQTPSKTPWWILLLRVLVAALVILGLAGPIKNISRSLPSQGPLRIVIDNGWAAAQTWDLQIEAAKNTLNQAAREKRSVMIVTTALPGGQSVWPPLQIMDAGQAKGALDALEPLPWPEDYAAAADFMELETARLIGDQSIASLWFSHGIYQGTMRNLSRVLRENGRVYFHTPPAEALPIALKNPAIVGRDLSVDINAPSLIPAGTPVSVQVLNERGQVIDQKQIALSKQEDEKSILFDIVPQRAAAAAEMRVTNRSSAASVLVLDSFNRQRSLGIIGVDGDNAPKPFIEVRYFLSRALEDNVAIFSGTPRDVLKKNPSVVVMPDTASMPTPDLNALNDWVDEGGVLLRFAGPNMLQSDIADMLVPVRLRLGSRSMEGALTWDEPRGVGAIPEGSPLAGIVISPDIKVNTQILAEPEDDLVSKIWAQLEDGTPLITAAAQGSGLLVFVHTTASPLWSDLVLSGTYVEILQRILALSGNVANIQSSGNGVLQPVWVLDGFGQKVPPPGFVQPIASTDFSSVVIDQFHPPGLYAFNGIQKSLNLGDHLSPLRAASAETMSATGITYGATAERDYMPILLMLALGLLLVDWVVMLFVAGHAARLLRVRRLWVKAALVLCVAALFAPLSAQAQDDVRYADDLYLAYIKSGNAALDSVTQRGLDNLAATLHQRTSVEPKGSVGLDLERDSLVFFPFIYWPVSNAAEPLSTEALQKVQYYLDHGGTILLDTRDGNADRGDVGLIRSATATQLQILLGGLNIPALQPINDSHVLGKSFYLLDRFVGQRDGGTFWVEQRSLNGGEDVSSVMIGANDWAGEWANDNARTRRHEMSMRFGVNVVMYALTGNYKADQVHLKSILERLGQ